MAIFEEIAHTAHRTGHSRQPEGHCLKHGIRYALRPECEQVDIALLEGIRLGRTGYIAETAPIAQPPVTYIPFGSQLLQAITSDRCPDR